MSIADWIIVVVVWSLIPACLFAKWYRDRQLGRGRRRIPLLGVAPRVGWIPHAVRPTPPPRLPSGQIYSATDNHPLTDAPCRLTRADVDEFSRRVNGSLAAGGFIPAPKTAYLVGESCEPSVDPLNRETPKRE